MRVKTGINKLLEREPRYFVRFAVVGLINTLVDFLVFSLCFSGFGLNYFISQAFGYSAGVCNSFLLNKTWTFRDETPPRLTLKQPLQFAAVNLLSLGVSLLALAVLEYWGWKVYPSKILVTVITQLINYSGYRFWVFQRRGPGKDEDAKVL